jgi:hypothetical protein
MFTLVNRTLFGLRARFPVALGLPRCTYSRPCRGDSYTFPGKSTQVTISNLVYAR